MSLAKHAEPKPADTVLDELQAQEQVAWEQYGRTVRLGGTAEERRWRADQGVLATARVTERALRIGVGRS